MEQQALIGLSEQVNQFKKRESNMLSIILSLILNQNISKENFLLIEKDPISFYKIVNEIKKPIKQEECFP